MNTVAIKIKENISPSGKVRGYRIVASTPNLDRWQYDFQTGGHYWMQSNIEKYQIRATLDYADMPAQDGKRMGQFVRRLKKWHKVTHVTFDQFSDVDKRAYAEI